MCVLTCTNFVLESTFSICEAHQFVELISQELISCQVDFVGIDLVELIYVRVGLEAPNPLDNKHIRPLKVTYCMAVDLLAS